MNTRTGRRATALTCETPTCAVTVSVRTLTRSCGRSSQSSRYVGRVGLTEISFVNQSGARHSRLILRGRLKGRCKVANGKMPPGTSIKQTSKKKFSRSHRAKVHKKHCSTDLHFKAIHVACKIPVQEQRCLCELMSMRNHDQQKQAAQPAHDWLFNTVVWSSHNKQAMFCHNSCE